MSNHLTKQDIASLINADDEDMKKLFKSNEILKERKSQKIVFSEPILKFQDNPFIYANTMNVCQGKTGVHKSRFVEMIISAILCLNQNIEILLGITTNSKLDFNVIHFDTERNIREQFPYAIQQIERNAGGNISEFFDNYHYYSFIEIDRDKRLGLINRYLSNYLSDNIGKHTIIVIDVLSDLVMNFNDPGECLLFIDMLNQMINKYDVTFLLVIHENPGTDKSRGHLGTEMQNKASTLFRIAPINQDQKKNDDEFKIEFLKCRSTKRLDPIFIKYSEEGHCLIIIDAKEPTNEQRLKAPIDEVIVYLEERVYAKQLQKNKKDLIADLKEEFDCSDNTIRERLKNIIYDKMILMIDEKKYNLVERNKNCVIEIPKENFSTTQTLI